MPTQTIPQARRYARRQFPSLYERTKYIRSHQALTIKGNTFQDLFCDEAPKRHLPFEVTESDRAHPITLSIHSPHGSMNAFIAATDGARRISEEQNHARPLLGDSCSSICTRRVCQLRSSLARPSPCPKPAVSILIRGTRDTRARAFVKFLRLFLRFSDF